MIAILIAEVIHLTQHMQYLVHMDLCNMWHLIFEILPGKCLEFSILQVMESLVYAENSLYYRSWNP